MDFSSDGNFWWGAGDRHADHQSRPSALSEARSHASCPVPVHASQPSWIVLNPSCVPLCFCRGSSAPRYLVFVVLALVCHHDTIEIPQTALFWPDRAGGEGTQWEYLVCLETNAGGYTTDRSTGLLPLLKSIHKPCNIKKFSGQTIGVDGYGWLHRGTAACAIDLAMDKPTTKYAFS